MNIAKFISKHRVILPIQWDQAIKAKGLRLVVRSNNTISGKVPSVYVEEGESRTMLGRYFLGAGNEHVLIFKDGNRLNHALDNLELRYR